MSSRVSKQIVIGGIYLFIVVLIVGGMTYTKYRPICTDGIKNGEEEGVDCGTIACGKACVAPIQALVTQSVQVVHASDTDSSTDVAIQIYNPNTEYGVSEGVYDLVIKDSSGAELDRRSGNKFYMLSGQTKYLVLTAVSGLALGEASVEIKSVEWEKVTSQQDNPFVITRETTTADKNQTIYQAVITNNSNFDFDTIDVSLIVTDGSGAIIATNMTNFQTFFSRTDRSIKIIWPFVFPADARIKTEVDTNVFNDANFLKRNGTQEKFQQYY